MSEQTFTINLNGVDVEFTGEWLDHDGERWEFFVLTNVVGAYGRQCDGINTSNPTLSDLKSTLAYLDKPQWPSEDLPQPQIGDVSSDTLNSICTKIATLAKADSPEISPQESYFGV
jgi:hypothetical protein